MKDLLRDIRNRWLKPRDMRLPKDMINLMKENEKLKIILAEKDLAIEMLQDALKKGGSGHNGEIRHNHGHF